MSAQFIVHQQVQQLTIYLVQRIQNNTNCDLKNFIFNNTRLNLENGSVMPC